MQLKKKQMFIMCICYFNFKTATPRVECVPLAGKGKHCDIKERASCIAGQIFNYLCFAVPGPRLLISQRPSRDYVDDEYDRHTTCFYATIGRMRHALFAPRGADRFADTSVRTVPGIPRFILPAVDSRDFFCD